MVSKSYVSQIIWERQNYLNEFPVEQTQSVLFIFLLLAGGWTRDLLRSFPAWITLWFQVNFSVALERVGREELFHEGLAGESKEKGWGSLQGTLHSF